MCCTPGCHQRTPPVIWLWTSNAALDRVIFQEGFPPCGYLSHMLKVSLTSLARNLEIAAKKERKPKWRKEKRNQVPLCRILSSRRSTSCQSNTTGNGGASNWDSSTMRQQWPKRPLGGDLGMSGRPSVLIQDMQRSLLLLECTSSQVEPALNL